MPVVGFLSPLTKKGESMFTRILEAAPEHPCCSTSINRGSWKPHSQWSRALSMLTRHAIPTRSQFCSS